MPAGFEKLAGQFVMRHSRRHDAHPLGLFQDGFHGFQYSNAILIGYLLGALDIGIIQPHELHITRLSHFGINPGMMLA